MNPAPISRRAALRAATVTAAAAAFSASTVFAQAPPKPGKIALSEAELFAGLNYATPGLASVKAMVDKNDMPGAKRAFAAYLRARTSVPWSVPTVVADRSQVKWNPKKAQDAADGKIVVVTVPHTFPNGDIDWHYDATGGASGLPKNNEWVWQLNRMGWWGDLSSAYQATGDEKWARAWTKQFRSWVAQNPPPEKADHKAGASWRPIETGLRMAFFWPQKYHAFLRSPEFTDQDLVDFVRVSAQHARYLAAFPSAGNHLTMEMSGLYTVGALFPELGEAKAWREQAANTMYKEFAIQFLPDSAQYELAPGYHNVALDNFLKLASVAKMTNRESELPADFLKKTESAFAFNLLLMTPNRSLPRFNDAWDVNVRARLADGVRLFPARQDFVWGATDGKEGKAPTQTSHAFDWAGYFVMRADWSRTANFAILDAGPLGMAHIHQDKNNFVAWAHGREILFDSGGGSYEQSKWRDYAIDTFSHNTVLVDNLPQRRDKNSTKDKMASAPIDARWQTNSDFDFAQGVYDQGYGTLDGKIAVHTRRVLFVKNPGFWIVSDILTPRDDKPHTYQARWNLLTTNTKLSGNNVETTDTGLPNMAVVPLSTGSGALPQVRVASAQTEGELLGWNIRKDMDPQYLPATTVLHTKAGVTGEQRFITLVMPLEPGETVPAMASQILVTERGTSGTLEVAFPQNGKTRRVVGGAG